VYALKMIFNMHGLTSRGIRHRYQAEFAHFHRLTAAREACRRAGRRDGLVRFHNAFIDKVTDEIVAMLPEDVRAAAVPGTVVVGAPSVALFDNLPGGCSSLQQLSCPTNIMHLFASATLPYALCPLRCLHSFAMRLVQCAVEILRSVTV
jgi:hypothetical protein